jgi:hypothetical protein
MEHFEKELERLAKRLDPRFAALARWLHTHQGISPADLLTLFKAEFDTNGKNTRLDLQGFLGEPDDALIELIGTEEYGSRSKENFFAKEGREGGKDGIKAICEVLQWLEGEEAQNHARGIERLANWLAALAGHQQGGSQ